MESVKELVEQLDKQISKLFTALDNAKTPAHRNAIADELVTLTRERKRLLFEIKSVSVD